MSVVIPCYNGEEYVGDAIESALRQTHRHIEVIVVDDGSTDRSLDVIRSFGDLIRCETGPNCGGCAARNLGVSIAQGEYIQFLDSDDLLDRRKIEVQLQCVLETDSLAVCSSRTVDFETNEELGIFTPNYDDMFTLLCLQGIPISSVLHSRKLLIDVGGFDSSLPCAQEFDLHIRLALIGAKFKYVPDQLLTLRSRENSVSSNYVKVMKQWERIVVRACEMAKPSDHESKKTLSEILGKAASHLADRGEFDAGRKYIGLAKNIHPSGGLARLGWKRRVVIRSLGLRGMYIIDRLHRMFSRGSAR
ncbi:glycosyltransferase [Verrucomicrobiales bacterium]|nr:glycosyltransferase [Verrucomicrobiales bacterium]